MRIQQLLESKQEPDFPKILKDFLPLAMKELGIDKLPRIKLELRIADNEQPTFGKFVNDENVIYLAIEDRHPLDILRTLAHELTHFKQGAEHRLDAKSGETGSPIENEAHEMAGIIMRNFNKLRPQYFNFSAINLKEDWNKVNHRDKTNGLSQKAVNAYRRENPGSKLQTAVTTKPSKLKAGSKDAKRRKSFCARMSGNKGPMKKPNGKPTPKALALRRWNCESVEEMIDMIIENMDHSKDNQAVPELKAALLARKTTLQKATDEQVYDIIDKIMTRIAKSHGISGQKLHDMWVDQYDQVPDTWIMK
jgi:Zn-dependent peptidase ImmA (M78 family)